MAQPRRIAARVQDGQTALAAVVVEYAHLLESRHLSRAERARLERAKERAIARITGAVR